MLQLYSIEPSFPAQDALLGSPIALDFESPTPIFTTETSPGRHWTPTDFFIPHQPVQCQGYMITDENFNSYEVFYSPQPTTPSTSGPPSLIYSTPEAISPAFTPERSSTPSSQSIPQSTTSSSDPDSANLIHCPYPNCDKSFSLPHQFK